MVLAVNSGKFRIERGAFRDPAGGNKSRNPREKVGKRTEESAKGQGGGRRVTHLLSAECQGGSL